MKITISKPDYVFTKTIQNTKIFIRPSRSMVAETHLMPSDFIAPLFIDEGKQIRQEIASMPGYFRNSLDITVKEVKELYAMGLKSVLLFVNVKTN